MIQAWKDLRFSAKLTLIFFLVLSLTIGVITIRQSYSSFRLLEEKSLEDMENLAEQVILNFTQTLEDIENSCYVAMISREVPKNMSGSATYAVQKYTLATMISSATSYDYIMTRNSQRQLISTDFRNDMPTEQRSQIVADCRTILEEHQENTLVRDVYDTQPLRHMGVIVLHIRQPFFAASSASENTGFLFLDKNGDFLTYTGTELPEGMTDEVIADAQAGALSSKNNWSGGEYFAVSVAGSQWSVIVISMKEVANGNFDSRIEVTDADDISQLALAFNDMSQRISELMAELVEKERMRSNAELQVLEYKYRALETQIRPHFIYNALEVISSMAKIKGETEMIDIVQTISRYFRNITQSTTDQFITVQQEFDRLQDYTRIYQFMHGDHLKTVFSARETARNAMIPTMILQPVVENSLKYGLRSQEEDSEIRVHAYTQDGKLLITIRDNGKGLTQEQMEKLEKGETAESSSSGIGMANVRQRLKLIYGDKSSISFRNRTAGGVKVTIEIPFTYSEPDSLWELEQMDDWSDLDELW